MITQVRGSAENSDLRWSAITRQRAEVQTLDERRITMRVEKTYKLKVLLIQCAEVRAVQMLLVLKDPEIPRMEEKEAPTLRRSTICSPLKSDTSL